MASSFSSYYVARSGIQAAQYNLKITGQNMSNVNTAGYTRQRLDSYAVASSGNNKRYSNAIDLAIGDGVSARGVSQLRDPYLDVRYRMESAKVGKSGTEANTLQNLESIFDEIQKNGINTQLTDLVKQLNTLAGSPSDTNLESIVKNSAQLLTQAFRNAAEQLSQIRKQETDSFESGAISKANNILQNIAQLNREIKSADISQVPALELLDQRNTLLDELSQQFDIQVSTTSVSVGAGRTVEELQVSLVAGGKYIPLINNDQYVQFEMAENANTIEYTASNSSDPMDTTEYVYAEKELNVSVYMRDFNGQLMKGAGDTPKVMNDSLDTGIFGGYLSMLNDSGEYDALAGGTYYLKDANGVPTGVTVDTAALPITTRGIGYYEKMMDQFAAELAKTLNAVNSVTTKVAIVDGAGNPVLDADGNPTYETKTVEKPLFSSSEEGKPITASTIAISDEWNKSIGNFITASKEEQLEGVDNSSSGKNILYMVLQFSKERTFQTGSSYSHLAKDNTGTGIDGTTLFTSSLNSLVSKVSTNLGLDIESTVRQNETYVSNLTGIDTQRASISSVDLNEEGINLIMYNQALTASSRFMTTMDEALDTIINRMGIVGR